MFCPKCRTEFIEGVTECSDCYVPLVSELEEKDETIHGKLVNIFTTNNSIEANFIKSLLGSNNIKCTIINEHLVSINILFSSAIPINVAVEQENEPRATEIISQYYKDLQDTDNK